MPSETMTFCVPLWPRHSSPSATWRAVASKYPCASACRVSAAPSKPDVLSEWLNQRLAAGDANRTSGFKVALSSTPDMFFSAGSVGKLLRSSSPDKAMPTASGAGAHDKEILITAKIVDKKPLIISIVSRYDDHACIARGVSLRTETLRTSATSDKSGSTGIKNISSSRTQSGTGLGKRGRASCGPGRPGGGGGGGCLWATSCGVMTIGSMKNRSSNAWGGRGLQPSSNDSKLPV